MLTSYDASLDRLLKDEGGYTNHPSDPGGPTNWGITLVDARKYWKSNATAADVRSMPLSAAKAIYARQYWTAQRCDDLPVGVDYAIFDYGVNSGIGRSGKVLRRCLGLPDNTSVVTQQVVDAARKADPVKLCNAIWNERLAFLKSLKTFPVFGRGWTTRVTGGKAFSLVLIGAVAVAPPPVATAGKGAVPLNKKAQAGTAGSAVIVGTSATATPGISPWAVAAVVVATLAVTAAAVLFWQWKQKQQQEAPVLVPVAA